MSELNFANSPINQSLTPERKIELYTQMVRIRRFEQVSLANYQKEGRMGGFLHLYIGQESVAVGTLSLCGENDHNITAYRCHAHALTSGMSMNECMAELYGKQTGCSKGKGGSMHFFAPDKNFWGGHGIVAGQTPLGLGLAYGLKYLEKEGCCLCFLGDGAVNQGAFHESLNIASLFGLPVIYVIENNGYSMGTSQKPLLRLHRLPGPARRGLRHRMGCDRRLRHLRGPRENQTSPWSAPGRKANRPFWRSIPIATTATPSRMRTPRNTAPRRKSKPTRTTTTPSTSSATNCSKRAC